MRLVRIALTFASLVANVLDATLLDDSPRKDIWLVAKNATQLQLTISKVLRQSLFIISHLSTICKAKKHFKERQQ